MKLIALILASCIGVFLFRSCTSPERAAYNSVVSAKAFIDSVKSKHPECSNPDVTTLCQVLRRATAAKDVLIDAAEAYCSGAQFESGGACNPPDKKSPLYSQAFQKLQAAITGYDQTAKDLKGVIK